MTSAVLRTEPLFDKPVIVTSTVDQILVRADGILLEQVVVNLLENASRHAGRGAKVEILLGRARQMALLDVIDDGPGVPPAEAAKIFERFKGEATGGFGLGLAICKAAVEAHNGSIYLVPTDKGADFRIEFPIDQGGPIA